MKLHFREAGSDPYSQGAPPLLFSASAHGTSTQDDLDLEQNLAAGQITTPVVLQQKMGSSSSARNQCLSRPHARCPCGPKLLYIFGILVACAIPFCVPLAFSRAIRVFDRFSVSSLLDIRKNPIVHHEFASANSIEREGMETRNGLTTQGSLSDFANEERLAQMPRSPGNSLIPSGRAGYFDSIAEISKQLRPNIASTKTDCTTSGTMGGEGDSLLCSKSATAGTFRENRNQPEMRPAYVHVEKDVKTPSSRLAPYLSSGWGKQLRPSKKQETAIAVLSDDRPIINLPRGRDIRAKEPGIVADVGGNMEQSDPRVLSVERQMMNLPVNRDIRATEQRSAADLNRNMKQDGFWRPLSKQSVPSSSDVASYAPDSQNPLSSSSDVRDVEVKEMSDPWSEHAEVQNERLLLSKTFENRLNSDVGPMLAEDGELWDGYPKLCNERWRVFFLLDQSPKLEAELELTVACGEGQTCTLRPRLHDLNRVQVSIAGTDEKVYFVRTFTSDNVEGHRWGPLQGPLRATILSSSAIVARRYCESPPQSHFKIISVQELQKHLHILRTNSTVARLVDPVSRTNDPFVYEALPHFHIQRSEKNQISSTFKSVSA